MINKKHLLWAVGLGLIASISKANIVTVGIDPSCDFNLTQSGSLQDAINTAGVTEVRVSNDTSLTSGITINHPMILSGGFDNCIDGAAGIISQDTYPNTTIDVAGNGRPVTIINTSPGTIEINYFDLKNGNMGTTNTMANGGGLYVDASNQADVSLDHSRLFQNTAFGGGGLYFDGSTHNTKLTIKDSLIGYNLASNTANSGFNGGGGLFINGGSLLMYGETTIRQNNVTSNNGFAVGGGIFAANATMTLVGGSTNTNNGFIQNTAGFRGGAIYLGGGVTLSIYGRPVELDGETLGTSGSAYFFTSNDGGSEGGGAIFSVQSTINLEQVEFTENTGVQLGGAIGLLESTLNITAENARACRYYPIGCNIFNTNFADYGGAIWARVDSNINVQKTLFAQNGADEGTSLYLGNSLANFETVVIVEEAIFPMGFTNDNVIRSDEGNVTIKYTNIISNHTNQSIFKSSGIGTNVGIDIYNSIVHNPLVANLGIATDQASNEYFCVLSDAPGATATINVTQYNGLFVDPVLWNFQLKPGAIAIDYCNVIGNASPLTTDYLKIERGHDDVATIDMFGTYDAGAHEYNDDLIFKNEFEFF
ncbi:MAG: hypothetical protein R3E90_04365 [Marinicella sp.]